MLPLYQRVKLVGLAFAILSMALHAVVFIQLLALVEFGRTFSPFTLAVFRVHWQLRGIVNHISQCLGTTDGLRYRKRIHGRVITIAFTNVRQLLDQDFWVLTSQLRKGAVWLAPAFGQVTASTDLVHFNAVLMVRLECQCFITLTAFFQPGQGCCRKG